MKKRTFATLLLQEFAGCLAMWPFSDHPSEGLFDWFEFNPSMVEIGVRRCWELHKSHPKLPRTDPFAVYQSQKQVLWREVSKNAGCLQCFLHSLYGIEWDEMGWDLM